MVEGSVDRAVTDIEGFIRDVPDFPNPGIIYKDITPLLADVEAFAHAVDAMSDPWRDLSVDFVVGVEARGFILGAPVAQALGAGFVPARKGGKLPSATISETYGLEYGTDSLEMHSDALAAGDRVVVIDDVLATGGTAAAAARLIDASGADLLGFGFLIELEFLDGRDHLPGRVIHSVLSVPGSQPDRER